MRYWSYGHRKTCKSPKVFSFSVVFSITAISRILDGSRSYVIKHNTQDKLHHQQSFLFYNCHNRAGAREEATKLRDALIHIGFTCQVAEWESVYTLPVIMKESLAHHQRCAFSAVVVGIMAHGKFGLLSDSKGSLIPLNYILHLLSHMIPHGTPLVSSVVFLCCLWGRNFNTVWNRINIHINAQLVQRSSKNNHWDAFVHRTSLLVFGSLIDMLCKLLWVNTVHYYYTMCVS